MSAPSIPLSTRACRCHSFHLLFFLSRTNEQGRLWPRTPMYFEPVQIPATTFIGNELLSIAQLADWHGVQLIQQQPTTDICGKHEVSTCRTCMQEVPYCLRNQFWLRHKLVQEWGQRIASRAGGHRRSHHIAVATECFLAVANNPRVGGRAATDTGYNMCVCAWMVAALTSMVHVSGTPLASMQPVGRIV